jgi:hypothetical protein
LRIAHLFTIGAAVLTLASWADSTASFGSSIRVPAGETRDGDIVALGGSVVVDGTVTQDVTVIGGDAVINGTVGHDVTSLGGHVTLGPHASVGHDVVIVAGSLSRDPHAQIGGQVVRDQPTVPFFAASGSRLGQLSGLSLAFGIGTAVAMTIIALVLLLVFPRQLQTAGATVARRPLESLAVGCVGTIAGVTLAIVLAITVIGIPVSLAVVAAMTAAGFSAGQRSSSPQASACFVRLVVLDNWSLPCLLAPSWPAFLPTSHAWACSSSWSAAA